MFLSRAVLSFAAIFTAACATTEAATPAPPPPLIPNTPCVTEPTATEWSPSINPHGGEVRHEVGGMRIWYDVHQTTEDPYGPVLVVIETVDHNRNGTNWQYIPLQARIPLVDRVVRCLEGSLERRWRDDFLNGHWKMPKKPKPAKTKKKGR